MNLKRSVQRRLNYVSLLFKQSKNPARLTFASMFAGANDCVFFKSKSGRTLRIKPPFLCSLLLLLGNEWKIVEKTDDNIITNRQSDNSIPYETRKLDSVVVKKRGQTLCNHYVTIPIETLLVIPVEH